MQSRTTHASVCGGCHQERTDSWRRVVNFSVSGFFSGGRSGDDTLDGGVTGPSYGGC